MFTVENLARLVFSYTLEKQKYYASTEQALRKILTKYIRPIYFDASKGGVRLDNLLVNAGNKLFEVDNDERKIFLEEAVTNFAREEYANTIRNQIIPRLTRKEVPQEVARKIITTNKDLTDEEKKKFDDTKKDVINQISKRIISFFENQVKAYATGKKRDTKKREELGPDIEVPSDADLKERALEEKWQDSLIEDVIGVINKESDENKQKVFKILLNDVYISKKPKTLKSISEEIDVSQATVTRWSKELKMILGKYLSEKGLGKYPEELQKKGLPPDWVPDYKEVLKNKDNLDDFWKYLHRTRIETGQSRRKPISKENIKVLELLAEGLDDDEIASKTDKAIKDIRYLKSSQFKKIFEKWYALNKKKIKEACERIIKALKIINAESPPPLSHTNAVDLEIGKKFNLPVFVTFSANYDNMDLKQDQKSLAGFKKKDSYLIDPEKDKIDFKYIKYQVKLNRTSKPTIKYAYTEKLTDDGKFEGNPKSVLTIAGMPGHPELKEKLDEYVRDEMKKEGVLPHGPKVESRKPVRIGVEYNNIQMDKAKTYDHVSKRDYRGFSSFANAYEGFMVKDLPQLSREELESARNIKKLIPTGGKDEIKQKIEDLKLSIEEEKEEKVPNTKKIKDWQDNLDDLEKHLKKDTVKQMLDFVEKNKDRFKFAVSEERQKNVKRYTTLLDEGRTLENRLLDRRRKYSPKSKEVLELKKEIAENDEKAKELQKILKETKEPFPPPESKKVIEFLGKLSDLGIKDEKLNGYLTSDDLIFYVNKIQAALAGKAQELLKGIKKHKEMSEDEKIEDSKSVERKRGVALNEFIEFFEAIPADMKKRLSEYEKKDPSGFKTLEKKLGARLLWVNAPEKVITKIKENLSISKPLVTPKEQRQPASAMEEENAKYVLKWVDTHLRGFAVIGDRFGKASQIAEGLNPADRKTMAESLSKSEKEFQDLQNKIDEMEKETIPKEMKILKDDIPKYVKTISDLKKALAATSEIPALVIGKVLSERITDFNSMYNPLSNSLWFNAKTYQKMAVFEVNEGDEKITKLQKNIANQAINLARQNIFDSKSIQSLTKIIQSGLTNFKKGLSKMASLTYNSSFDYNSLPYVTVQEKTFMKQAAVNADINIFGSEGAKKIDAFFVKLKEILDDKSYEEGVKSFDEFERDYADGIKKVRKAIPVLKDVDHEDLTAAIQQIGPGLARDFISQWDHLLIQPKKTEGKKFTHLYDLVMEEVPELKTDIADEKISLSKGMPTPAHIREYFEDLFTEDFAKKMEQKYKNFKYEDSKHKLFKDISGAGGGSGGGGGGGGRQKEPKGTPPSYAMEILKKGLKEALLSKSANVFILEEIKKYLMVVENYAKAGHVLDVNQVIEGIITLVFYEFKKGVKKLRVSDKPMTTTTYKKKGPPPPDIYIKDDAEGEKVFDKINDIYQLINNLVSDEKGKGLLNIGPKQKSLYHKSLKPGDQAAWLPKGKEPENWFPYGLTQYVTKTKEDIEKGMEEKHKMPEGYKGIKKYKEKGKGTKKASAQFLAFRIAHKFSSLDLQEIESLEVNK